MFYVYHIGLPGFSLDQGYVGVTNNPRRRWLEHKTARSCKHLAKAVEKYGDKLVWKILDSFKCSKDAYWLEYTLRPFPNMGWNICSGGDRTPDPSLITPESRKRAGLSNRGKKRTKEFSKTISEHNRNRVCKPETREKMRLSALSRTTRSITRPVNIHCYKTDIVLFEGVSLNTWSKENSVSCRLMYDTLKANPLEKSSRSNVHQTKGYYARYML